MEIMIIILILMLTLFGPEIEIRNAKDSTVFHYCGVIIYLINKFS